MIKYSDVIGRKYMYMYFAHLLELLFFFFEIVTLIEIYIICIVKAYSKTWRTGARLVGFVINEKKDILFYNLMQFRYTVHSSLRKVVAICIQIR